jgi:lipopolysaccharide heptosyltransferase II
MIRLPNPVGDVVMTTPLLRVLRTELPTTRLVLAGKEAYRELLAGLDSYDQFLPKAPTLGGTSGLRAQARWLSQAQADAVLILPNSWSSALAARLAGIPRRIGRRARGRAWLLSDRLETVGPARAMTRIYLEMLEPLGIAVPAAGTEPHAELVVEPLDPASGSGSGDRLNSGLNVDLERCTKFLGIAPGAAFGPSKSYPVDLLAETARQVQAQTNLQPMLLGSPNETGLLQAAAFAMKELGLKPILPTPAGFAQAKLHISGCAAFLTMDSGARHIAAALRIPQVVLYGPTHPGWSAHALDRTTILRRDDVDCLNCHHKICPIDHRCMTRLEPAEVAQAVLAAVPATAASTAQQKNGSPHVDSR